MASMKTRFQTTLSEHCDFFETFSTVNISIRIRSSEIFKHRYCDENPL
ncbi:hypothetical protein NEISICOT_01462 [Neisseria sicca ATCC 29256]|uniref:Uncharacterized protein n=3 Tax=Neisseria TaxID=482 RepID=A0AA36UI43_9NEIS|nr:hypothetical protein NEISICOT_01462 [Neisseria sicca ATCC 29256]EGQ76275.1 hypothetical protein HMPREF9418_2070 [Neisseria macacae ATCC 33926]KJJ21125.1 hypothetical protein HMPREF3156_00372 [Neisseria sp. HMSC06F02]